MDKIMLGNKIHIALNQELIRRLLIQYFATKGFNENFDKRIYPPQLVDLVSRIPRLNGKVEVTAFVQDIDPLSGAVKLGWNLFVLGTKRMYLGESTHTSLAEITGQITTVESSNTTPSYATPKRIVEFITKVLGNSKSGDISASHGRGVTSRSVFPVGTGENSGYFRRSQRPVF